MKIDAMEVERVFKECLYRTEELSAEGEPPVWAVTVELFNTYNFEPDRLEAHREQIRTWLHALPASFQTRKGWSFLGAGQDNEGEQWTDFHYRMEQLFCLGLGLKLCHLAVPRDLWKLFPGGAPFFAVEA